jgi:uncharacterized Tic20 family protein
MPGEASNPGYAPPPAAGPQYGTPPPAGYGQPPGGYPGAPGPGVAPPGYASNEDKTWALVAHFGGALGMLISGGWLGFVAPLVAYMARGQQSPTVRAHAVAALNFQILWSIIGFVLLFVSWCLLFVPTLAVMAIGIIFGIIGGIRANEGQLYRYPMSYAFIK